ncbi:hypothetical protein [Variovorax sp. YR750]|uniref:hypothetical protein n=1 Tax=Variovorax sp. YR750 TaxID=1884384 RepID=UPI001160BB74|nr:hypothetical protein [Variovorax sp. YR750]
MKSIQYILLAVVLAATGSAQAEKAMGGIGVAKCDVWLTARKQPRPESEAVVEQVVLAWVQGYLSSKNADGVEDRMLLDVPSHGVINRVLDHVCGENPGLAIYLVADDFARLLMKQYREKKHK